MHGHGSLCLLFYGAMSSICIRTKAQLTRCLFTFFICHITGNSTITITDGEKITITKILIKKVKREEENINDGDKSIEEAKWKLYCLCQLDVVKCNIYKLKLW